MVHRYMFAIVAQMPEGVLSCCVLHDLQTAHVAVRHHDETDCWGRDCCVELIFLCGCGPVHHVGYCRLRALCLQV